jgi:[protein-PII] uridylyltransferase
MFMDILTSHNDPETVLRWMSEAGVFGRFIPDFARVIAQMQFDMYHHYTVDEHTIRAIGLLARFEKGEERAASARQRNHCQGRLATRALCRDDVARHCQGRRGDHSILGAEVAMKLCPRLGLSPAETEWSPGWCAGT